MLDGPGKNMKREQLSTSMLTRTDGMVSSVSVPVTEPGTNASCHLTSPVRGGRKLWLKRREKCEGKNMRKRTIIQWNL